MSANACEVMDSDFFNADCGKLDNINSVLIELPRVFPKKLPILPLLGEGTSVLCNDFSNYQKEPKFL